MKSGRGATASAPTGGARVIPAFDDWTGEQKKYGYEVESVVLSDEPTQRMVATVLQIRSGERVLDVRPWLNTRTYQGPGKGVRLTLTELDALRAASDQLASRLAER